jgi:hypothetical protein
LESLAGATVGNYRIERVWAEGRGVALCRALDRSSQVACTLQIYTLSPEYAATTALRLQRAAAGEQHIIHPNLAPLHAAGAAGMFLYAATDVLPGMLLAERLSQFERAGAWLLPVEALLIVRQLAGAADACLRQGTLPRDIHPTTVALDTTATAPLPLRVMVADLGLRRLLDDAQATRVTGMRYLRPADEDRHPLDAPGQVYVLGRLLLDLLVGPQVASGTHVSAAEMLDAMQPALPAALAAIVRRALDPDLRRRFAGPAELSAALEALLPVARSMASGPAGLALASLVEGPRAAPRPASGNKVEETEPNSPQPGAPATGAPPHRRISVHVGEQQDRVLAVHAAQIAIGSERGNDLVLPGKGVSRRHARLDFAGTGCTVTDLGSMNGTSLDGQRLEAGRAYPWPPGQILQIVTYELSLAPVAASQGEVTLTVRPPVLAVEAGRQSSLKVDVYNAGETVVACSIAVLGVAAEWLTIAPPTVELMNGEQKTVEVRIVSPRAATSRAGEYPLHLSAIDQAGQQAGTASATIDLLPFASFGAGLSPTTTPAGKPMIASIENKGNAAAKYQLLCRSLDGKLGFTPESEQVAVEAGATLPLQLTARPLKRRWIGRAETAAFEVAVTAEVDKSKEILKGEAVCPALLPAWTPMLVLALVALAVLAYMLLPAPRFLTASFEPSPIVRGDVAYLSWAADEAGEVQLFWNGTPTGTPLPPVGTVVIREIGDADIVKLQANNLWYKETVTVVPIVLVDPTSTATATAVPLPPPAITGCQPSRSVFMVGEPADRIWTITCAFKQPERISSIEARTSGASPIPGGATPSDSITLPVPGGEPRQQSYDVVATASDGQKANWIVSVAIIRPELVADQEVWLRTEPYILAETEGELLTAGTVVIAESRPFQSDGERWIQATANGKRGYVAVKLLAPKTGVDVEQLDDAQNVPLPPDTPTPAPTPTATPTAAPNIEGDFSEVTIRRGESLTLRWRIRNIREVYLNGEPVPGDNNGSEVTQVVRPEEDTTYEWRIVEQGGGIVTKEKRVRVQQPTPTPAPAATPVPG